MIIEDSDIDFLGHVNNAVYLKWIQAAALEHWHRIATPDAVALHHWIAVKHEIGYRPPAFLRDQFVASVMLDRVQRESAFYESVIRRGSDVIAEVKSRWCCIDAARHKALFLPALTVLHKHLTGG